MITFFIDELVLVFVLYCGPADGIKSERGWNSLRIVYPLHASASAGERRQ
jgi:hypothetical protein